LQQEGWLEQYRHPTYRWRQLRLSALGSIGGPFQKILDKQRSQRKSGAAPQFHPVGQLAGRSKKGKPLRSMNLIIRSELALPMLSFENDEYPR